jgi:hypothetical protein
VVDSPGTTRTADAPIYLVGTSGHPNYGDEFIAAGWLRYLGKARPDTEVWLDCPNPGFAFHLFRGLHPRLRVTDSLWRLVRETEHMGADEGDAHVDRLIAHLGTPRYDLGLLTARKAGTIHFIGGGYINTVWPFHVRLLRAALGLREISGARLVATGLGLVPSPDPEAVRKALSAFDHATVRDRPSAEMAGVGLGYEDAFLDLRTVAGVRNVEHVADGIGDVWVCLQSDLAEPAVFEAAVTAVREALTGPELAGKTVRYLEAMPGQDRAAYDRLADLIPEENFVPFLRLWQEEFPAKAGQTWITSRFHLHLLAAASGARGTVIEIDEDFYRTKHGSLVEAGTGWSVTPAGATTMTPPTWNHRFRNIAADLRKAKLEEAQQLYPPVEAPEPAPAPPVPERPRGRPFLSR